MPELAIVAALEREIRPLAGNWPTRERQYGGRSFKFFEKDNVVVICGGVGAEAARRATEAVISLYAPAVVYSVGFAGALQSRLRVGDIVVARRVVDARDGSTVDTGEGDGVLVTIDSIADPAAKSRLAASYAAVAADMEAAAVARGAQARGVRFAAVKVISDEIDFLMPPVQRFLLDGEFKTGRFLGFAAVRPWIWPRLVRLARNSRIAAHALCGQLERVIRELAVSGAAGKIVAK